jgi:large subunit ribosomal protein L29
MKVVEQLAELRAQGVAELQERVRDLDDQVFRLRLQRSMGQADLGNKIRPLRRQVARIKTVLREKGV